MIPILYDSTETAFTSNGLGRLRDCISCKVTEERNGIYECDFEYPINGQNYDRIQLGRIIGVEHDDTNDIQPFDIVSAQKPINGVVTFHAVHISYRQSKMVAYGSNINSLADAFAMLSNATPENPFSYSTDKTGATGYMASADGIPRTVRQFLGGVEGSILDTFGGEYEWDKWSVILHYSRGEEKDFSIRYGVDMTEYNEDIDYSETYSAVIPFWKNEESTIIGNKVSASGATYNSREECVPLDLTDKFENAPTTAQLETYAQSYLNSSTAPKQSIQVNFVRLSDSAEHSNLKNLYRCRLCDTIGVEFPRYKMKGRFKIVKTVYNVLTERFDEMELGTLSTTLSEALGIGESSVSDSSSNKVYVIESGTSGRWFYRKWSDGSAECWCYTAAESIACTTQWGSAYYSAQKTYSFPSGLFIPYPTINATLYDAGGLGWVTVSTWSDSSVTVYVSEPISTTRNMEIFFYVSGRWK